MQDMIDKVRATLPKVISTPYGLRAWVQDYKRDKIPTSLKQEIARACYQSNMPQEAFYNEVFTYRQFDNNKFKLA